MTKTTDQRQLRMLVDGLLAIHGIDDLSVTAQFCKAFNQFYASDEPARTRVEILDELRRGIDHGALKHDELLAIEAEIRNRVGISPVTKDWQEFIEFVWREEKQGRTIAAFLDWWLADSWVVENKPKPTRPDGWRVKWTVPFTEQKQGIKIMQGGGSVNL